MRGGIAWRQLPIEFPQVRTVYAVFARSSRAAWTWWGVGEEAPLEGDEPAEGEQEWEDA